MQLKNTGERQVGREYRDIAPDHLNRYKLVKEASGESADFIDIGHAAIADQRVAERILADDAYPGPAFPVSRQELRDNCVGEPFVEYFATGWPQLVAS